MPKLSTRFRHWKQNIQTFYQRGRYGYGATDLWSLDWYLATWMPKALRQLKGKATPPLAIWEQLIPGYQTISEKISDDHWKEAGKIWNSILEDMAKGFDSYREELGWDHANLPIDRSAEACTRRYKDIARSLDLLSKYFADLGY